MKIPSLRLKKWNVTRWLGRAACLTALCRAYPYILDHLYKEMKTSNSKDLKSLATNLYYQLISYDNFLFIHFYRDLAERMKRTSKQLQASGLQISQVGQIITLLCMQLEVNYAEDLILPGVLLNNDEYTDNVLTDLFGDDFQLGNSNNIIILYLINLGMKNMEHDLQSKKNVVQEVEITRITRGVNNSSKYMELLSKKSKEERLRDLNIEPDPIVLEVLNLSYLSSTNFSSS